MISPTDGGGGSTGIKVTAINYNGVKYDAIFYQGATLLTITINGEVLNVFPF